MERRLFLDLLVTASAGVGLRSFVDLGSCDRSVIVPDADYQYPVLWLPQNVAAVLGGAFPGPAFYAQRLGEWGWRIPLGLEDKP